MHRANGIRKTAHGAGWHGKFDAVLQRSGISRGRTTAGISGQADGACSIQMAA